MHIASFKYSLSLPVKMDDFALCDVDCHLHVHVHVSIIQGNLTIKQCSNLTCLGLTVIMLV